MTEESRKKIFLRLHIPSFAHKIETSSNIYSLWEEIEKLFLHVLIFSPLREVTYLIWDSKIPASIVPHCSTGLD